MKTRSIILLVAMLFVVVLAFASCNTHEHTWQDATCTTPKTCTECGETEGAALGHAEEVLEGKNATCTETGLTEGKKCSACDEILVAQETIPVTAHTEETVAGKAPTCTATGLTEGKKCSVCDTILVAQEEIPMVAHTEEVVPGKDATCTETGLTAGKKCSVCNATLEAQTELSKLPHSYDEGWDADCNVCGATRTCAHDGEKNVVAGKAPTCTDAGLTDGETCAICGDVTKAQTSIDALGHDMSEATCTAASKCQREGCTYVEGEALGHDYDEGTITTAPGCETKGVKLFSCTREGCDDSYEVDVDPIGHSYVDTVVPSTCIAKGYTEHVCSNCGDSYRDNETALAEHTYEGKVTAAPKCEEEGVKTYTCTVEGCGDSYTESIAATGHSEISHEGKAATCTEDGYEAYVTCANCDYTTYKSISATGHKGGKATCKELATCETCGEKYGTVDKVNGHHYGEADCESPATCELCGATSGEAIGHIDDNKDHVCDRTACDEAMGTCEDADKDHTCDYGCGKSYGSCEDADKDHDCDYGCDKVFGTCEDADKDHDCDYGCDKEYGTHADGDDKNHTCDYGCLEPVEGEVCVDDNKNHVCDECSGRVGGDCADDKNEKDADHLCDYCGASVGEVCYGGTATCTNKAVCVECGKEYGELLAHTYDQTKAVEAALKVKADCENSAVYYYSCSCGAVNKAEGAATFEAGEPLGHTEKTVAGKDATCTATGLTEGKICSVCNKTLVEQSVIPVADHTEETVAGKDATCTETGLTEGKKCSVCGANLVPQEEISALGHKYGEIEYVWSADNSTCTATTICGNDASHVITESVTVTAVKLSVSADKVTFTYDVEFANAAFAAQSKTIDGEMSVENKIATVYAPALAGRVASHDFVKFSLHNAKETQEFTIYYSEVDVWDGTSVSTGLAGSGTEEDPYLIQSAADFAYFAGVLNAVEGAAGVNYKVTTFSGQYFKMTKSVDLDGNLLIAGAHSGWNNYQGFFGTFDGNNCTIRGINVQPTTGTSSALFGCIAKGGTLKNLIVYGNVQGAATVGGVVGYQLGTVDNVTSYVTVTATGGTVGGIVANQESGAGVINNCVNYGSVTSATYIVGGITGSGGATITNCVNWGNVQAGDETAGGIAGTTKANGTISGCINYGDVKTTATNKGMIGGIAGKCLKPVSDCYNYGTITGVNTTGGIVGSTDSAISGCENHGAINASSWNVGGIAGSSSSSTITDCTNYGNITSTADCAGGIVGSVHGKVSGCTNYGTIKGTGRLGGIAYWSNNTIENCVNNGAIIGGWDIGGILGYVGDGISATITGCTNNGDITGTWNNGGIFGLAHDNAGTVTITGCTNNGKVYSYTGGQISIAVKAVITDCIENGSYVVRHELVHVDAKAPTCEEAGNVAYDNCTACGKNFDADGNELESVEVAALGHTEEIVAGKAATCTETGLTEGKKCSVCGTILVAQESIPAGHKDENSDAKCDACGANLCENHVAGEAVKENEVAATCEASGSYESVVRCSICTFEMSRDVIETAALGHDMVGVVDGAVKTYTCANNCGETYVKYLVTVNHLNLDGSVAAEAEVYEYDDNYIYTINAKTVSGKVASHDYVKGHILSAGGTVTIYYSEVDVWDGTSVSTSLSGSGTQADPYLIQSAADFAYFASVINAVEGAADVNYKVHSYSGQYIKMTKSIDLNGANLMIGMHAGWNNYQCFAGILDGNNCTIRGIGVSKTGSSSALFGCVQKNGAINNLSVYGSVTGDSTVGGVVAYLLGSMDNVTSYINVTSKLNGSRQGTVGGLVANQENSATGAMSNCVNYGEVVSDSYIVGGIAGSGGFTFTNCVNWGNVTGGDVSVGGIAGSTKNKGTISGCINYGDICTTTADSSKGQVGGIVGTCNKPVSNCVNYGTIKAPASVGSICGTNSSTTTDCVDNGEVVVGVVTE